MVKLSPGQMTGSNVLPRLTTKKQNIFFNTVAHYHGRSITRRMDSMENRLNNFREAIQVT
jgi:hypothetical protein